MTQTKKHATSLLTALETRIIPQVLRQGMDQMFVALPSWEEYQHLKPELPEGSWITHKPLKSKRRAVMGARAYGKTSVVNATWRGDRLQSARIPRLNFVLSGHVAIQLSDYVYHCRAGHAFLIPPDTPFPDGDKPHYEVNGEVEAACEMFMLLPAFGGANCWTNREWRDEKGTFCKDQSIASLPHSNAAPYLLRLMEEIRIEGKYQTIICERLLGLIVTTLHRELLEAPSFRAGTALPEQKERFDGATEHPVTQAQHYMQQHLRYPLTIENVARHVYMSRTVFTAQFRQRTGKSFNEFLNDCRLEEAKRLLSETNLGIVHIAAQVGLKPSRMRALFHERLGISPVNYRQQSNINIQPKVAIDGQ